MGREKDYSSGSDEDNNVRHDRFRSERFKDVSLKTHTSAHTYNSSSTKYRERSFGEQKTSSTKKYRDRSPPRRRLESPRKNELSSHRKEKECRNKYDNTNYYSRSNKYEKCDLRNQSHSRKKPSNEHGNNKESDDCSSSKTSSKKLSSILMNFDKKIESKRLNTEHPVQIGPTLPPHLTEKVEKNDELITDTSIGPALPSHLKPYNDDAKKGSDNVVIPNQPSKDVEAKILDKPTDCFSSIDQTFENNSSVSMGPELPPHLKNPKNNDCEDSKQEIQKSKLDEMISNKILNKEVDELNCSLEIHSKVEEEEDSFGPALPPNFKKRAVQGPMLPLGITPDNLEEMRVESSEDEDTFGPLPVGKMNMTQYQLELRAMEIKRQLEGEKSGSSKDIKKREEWMLELPPEKASNLGLGPRSFRMKEGPDMSNRSAWTDTPAEKKRKEEMALRGEVEPVNSEEVMRTAFVKERNDTMDKISKISKDQDEDRQKSLLEMHQKKLKKKKKKEDKEGKKKERRPFDRNIDLQVHRFDEAQKKAIFKKAQLLDTRFSSGESKYL